LQSLATGPTLPNDHYGLANAANDHYGLANAANDHYGLENLGRVMA